MVIRFSAESLMPSTKINAKEKALIQRYLIWCYKTTKESLDTIDRKFTQIKVDRFILSHIDKAQRQAQSRADYRQSVENFKAYIAAKEKDGLLQKFFNGREGILNSDYIYLQNRLNAVELAIRHFLGPRMLARINLQYEQEMTRRILESREH